MTPEDGLGLGFAVFGLLSVVFGVRRVQASPPRWVAGYRGWSEPATATWLFGLMAVCLGSAIAGWPTWPWWVNVRSGALVGLMPLSFLAFFVWCPPFLLPRWYHRARRAGVARDDAGAMTAFKALPADEQRRRARARTDTPQPTS